MEKLPGKLRSLGMRLMLVALLWPCAALADSGTLRIGGTGGAMGMMARVARSWGPTAGLRIEVLPALGTAGGLRAAIDGVLDLVVAGRPLSVAEMAAGLRTVLGLRTLYVLATTQRDPPSLTQGAVARLFAAPDSAWPDGTPVRVVLRPSTETDYLVMFALFPGTEQAVAALRRRDDIPLASTDQDNVEIAARLPGSLIGTTLTQILTERPDLRMVPIDGVAPSVASLQDDSYRYRKPFFLVESGQPRPAVQRLLAFLHSAQGQALMREAGCELDGE